MGSPGCAGRVHDDGDTDETDARSDDVVSVGPESVEDDPPGEAASDEDSAVGGKDPPEVGAGLEGGDEPVQAESDHAGPDEHEAPFLAHSLPDEPGTANLGDGGEDEQANRGEDGHDVDSMVGASCAFCLDHFGGLAVE